MPLLSKTDQNSLIMLYILSWSRGPNETSPHLDASERHAFPEWIPRKKTGSTGAFKSKAGCFNLRKTGPPSMLWNRWSYSSDWSGNPLSSKKTFCNCFRRFAFGATQIGIPSSARAVKYEGAFKHGRLQRGSKWLTKRKMISVGKYVKRNDVSHCLFDKAILRDPQQLPICYIKWRPGRVRGTQVIRNSELNANGLSTLEVTILNKDGNVKVVVSRH